MAVLWLSSTFLLFLLGIVHLSKADRFFKAESISSTLKDKHLIITGAESNLNYRLVQNATAGETYISGVAGEVLTWLSVHYKFTYAPLTDAASLKDKTGLLSLLMKGTCDVVVFVFPTTDRMALVDFSHPPVFTPIGYLIPRPESSVNFLAIIKPFTLTAWIGIMFATFAVLLSLHVFALIVTRASRNDANISIAEKRGNKAIFFAIVILLRQAGFCHNPHLEIRIVVGAWVLANFILSNYYTTLLISYETSPNPQPLIKSVQDLRNRPDIKIVTDKLRNTEELLLSAESGFVKFLGDKLRAYPQSSCPTSKKCIDLVKSGLHVYIGGRDNFLVTAMRADFQSTGQCATELGREFLTLRSTWAFRKEDNYVKYVNQGIMRLREAGLVQKWNNDFTVDVHQCIDRKKKNRQETEYLAPISVKGLTGAFILLLCGHIVSLIVLMFERIIFHQRHH